MLELFIYYLTRIMSFTFALIGFIGLTLVVFGIIFLISFWIYLFYDWVKNRKWEWEKE